MRQQYTRFWLSILIALACLGFAVGALASASPKEGRALGRTAGLTPPPFVSLPDEDMVEDSTPANEVAPHPRASFADQPHSSPPPLHSAGAGDVIEVFTNTWSWSTLGMVYDPVRNHVRYAHESVSTTIYDVSYVGPHIVLGSLTLSNLNSGWPPDLNNRTGAGYDASTDTYFLPDYNGDLSNADDNIVEINPMGTILNVWEMDDEVGSNDSADGSEIDSIIDIAVVPGSPTRYFASAAYDGSVVYEIVLTRTGTLWTPNSWSTVMTCTVPGLTDTLGIDYDAFNNVLYHSDWGSEKIVVTDLSCNVLDTLICPSTTGYNSGVTFVEGSWPSEIWVTNFSDDQTTRCEAVGANPTSITWDKWIDTMPWNPTFVHTAETSDTVTVVDVVTATVPLSLLERWDPQHLRLSSWSVEPNVGTIVTSLNSLRWDVPPFPQVVTVTKIYHVEPSTWTSTLLSETLWLNGNLHADRPVVIEKRQPILSLNSVYTSPVLPGTIATYTLHYENTGGYENNVAVSSTFPITAPFRHAIPAPHQVGPGGRWAKWLVGNLAGGDTGVIDVLVEVLPTAVPSQTLSVHNVILNHLNEAQEETFVDYHVEPPPSVVWDWEKRINGIPWEPDLLVTAETSDTIQVVEEVNTPADFTLLEFWDDGRLDLIDVAWEGGTPVDIPGGLAWEVPAGTPMPAVMTKTFHIQPCTWLETLLWEELWVDGQEVAHRPVPVRKIPSELWIDGDYASEIYPGLEVSFMLHYGNAGGYESQVWITNTFPVEAPFVASNPPPVASDPQGLWARWDVGSLSRDDVGFIDVTVAITAGLPPSTSIPIYDYIYDHAGAERDWTEIVYHIRPPEWHKLVNGEPWHEGLEVIVETGDIFEVEDVVVGHFNTNLVEFWIPEHLELIEVLPSHGMVVTTSHNLEWIVPQSAPEVVSLFKRFRVKECAWTHTPLHEELWVEGDLWHEKPVVVFKPPAELHLDAAYPPEAQAGERITYTLEYGNLGGYESRAWVTSTFPVEAPLIGAVPLPDGQDPLGRWAWWDVGDLATDEGGALDVSVMISSALQPGELVHIQNYVYDHVDIERVWTPITLTVQTAEPGKTVYLPMVLRAYGP